MTDQDRPQSGSTSSRFDMNSILIGSSQPDVLAEFYARVLDRPADMADGGYYGWQVGSSFLTLGPHSEINGRAKEPTRILFNFQTPEVRAEFARLKAMNVTVVKEPYELEGGWIATLADPDGNYFQLMSPFDMG